ncbi:MAG TPA: TetR-like C-terminal domain-containing protein [Iamia sp.]|jgi:AcrR family transcriptional regulator|nr:TetR-like C-terminal domain-containing protein [Iamia sp.]
MPRPADTTVRERLIDVATDLLAAGEEVTLRKVANAADTSTMGVYTHFDGMPGLMYAVRERAFARLAAELIALRPTTDPVADLVSTGSAYVFAALADPALYRVMFDIGRDPRQPMSASMTFAVLVAGVERAQADDRLDPKVEPIPAATQLWAMTHGVVSLVLAEALPTAALDEHLPPMYTAQLVAWGDGPRRAPASVRRGWRRPAS